MERRVRGLQIQEKKTKTYKEPRQRLFTRRIRIGPVFHIIMRLFKHKVNVLFDPVKTIMKKPNSKSLPLRKLDEANAVTSGNKTFDLFVQNGQL